MVSLPAWPDLKSIEAKERYYLVLKRLGAYPGRTGATV